MKLLPSTYQIAWGVAPFKAFPGAMTFGSHDFIYSWFGDTSKADDEGNSTFYAPLDKGAITVQQAGSDYTIVVDAQDDAGNNIKGTWTGPAEIKDARQATSEQRAALLAKYRKMK